MKRWGMLLLGCLLAQAVMAAVTLRITPQPAQAGEPVQITLIVDGTDASAMPDLTPLHGDFTITGTSRSTQYRAVNGQAKISSVWTVLAVPKHPGSLNIPPLQVGAQSTPAQTLMVMGSGMQPARPAASSGASSDASAATADGLWLSAKVDTTTPFVNQQVLLTVRLYSNQQLLEAQYTPPTLEDGLTVALGGTRNFREMVNGEAYTVEEQQYAVFAQKSGTLTIKAPSLRALVLDTVPRRFKVRAKPLTLDVRPIADTFSGKHWLIAKRVALFEQYGTSERVLKVGSAITRTFRLEAVGVPGQLLPALQFEAVNGASAYPESPKTQNSVAQNALAGTLVQKVTWVLDAPGEVTLPGVRVPWYNALTGKTEEATLPPRTVRVVPAAGSTMPVTPTSTSTANAAKPPAQSPAGAPTYYPWLAAVLGAGWLLTLLCWWWRAHHRTRSRRRERRALRRACRANNAQAAEQALLALARHTWPDARFLNLADISARIESAPLQQALSALQQVRFGADPSAVWNGRAFWRVFCSSRGMR